MSQGILRDVHVEEQSMMLLRKHDAAAGALYLVMDLSFLRD